MVVFSSKLKSLKRRLICFSFVVPKKCRPRWGPKLMMMANPSLVNFCLAALQPSQHCAGRVFFFNMISLDCMDILGTNYFSSSVGGGTQIYLYSRRDYPVYSRISFLKGSRFDPPNKSGLAHLYEHMVFAGTKSFLTKDKLVEELQQYGGGLHASTSKELININLAVADPTDFPQIVKIYQTLFAEQLFDAEVFQKEKNVVQVELANREQNSSLAVRDLFSSVCFSNSPLSSNSIGTKESINLISVEDIRSFHHDILSSFANIIISGGVDIDQTKHAFSEIGLNATTRKPISQSLTKNDGGIISIKHTNEPMIQVVFGFKTDVLGLPDYYNMEVVNDIIGSSRSSLLMKKLRYEAGLVYGVSSSQLAFSDCGVWGISTTVSKKSLAKVLDLICELLEDLKLNGFSDDQIERSKNKMLKTKRYSLQSS